MPVGTALGLLALLLVVATAGGLIWRARTGRVRSAAGQVITARDLDVPADLGAAATLVQFSTEFCARCPATRRVLGETAAGTDGVQHIEVDLTHRPDLASRFSVLSTPTVLILDGGGRVRGRIVGAPRPAELRERLTRLLEGRSDDLAA